MPRLTAGLSLVLPRWRWGRGRLDDVGGRGCGRGRGVLMSGGQLLLEPCHRRSQLIQLRLQSLASWPGGGRWSCHTLCSTIDLTSRLYPREPLPAAEVAGRGGVGDSVGAQGVEE